MVIIHNTYEFSKSVRKLQTPFQNTKFIRVQIMIRMSGQEIQIKTYAKNEVLL